MPIFNISKVGSVNSGSDVISKVYAGPDLVYSAESKGYLFRDFDPATGVLSEPTGALESGSGITEIVNYRLYYGFNGCKNLTGNISFPNLASIGNYGMYYCFEFCTSITGNISFPKLTTVGSSGMYYCFYACTGLTGSISFPSLTSIDNEGMYDCFNSCKNLTGRVDFPSLTSVGRDGLRYCFTGTGVTEVHFKASLSGNSQCTADKLGLTGNVYFDL